mmetsp:Transcript_7787/g.10682  ORF Transcript_7787/g.10682 Transcript_7787/m.10682 type:complete len:216 (-) Transcript_7787:316-963(-)
MNRSSGGKVFARSSVEDYNPYERGEERGRTGKRGKGTRLNLSLTGSVELKQRLSQHQQIQRYPTRRVVVVSRGASAVGTITKGGGDSIHSRSRSGSNSGLVSMPLSQSSLPIWSLRAAANIVVNNKNSSSCHGRKNSCSRSMLTAASLPVIIERKKIKAPASASAAVKNMKGCNDADNTPNNCACASINIKEDRLEQNDEGCHYDDSIRRNTSSQ